VEQHAIVDREEDNHNDRSFRSIARWSAVTFWILSVGVSIGCRRSGEAAMIAAST
jgi:hypothetical protein